MEILPPGLCLLLPFKASWLFVKQAIVVVVFGFLGFVVVGGGLLAMALNMSLMFQEREEYMAAMLSCVDSFFNGSGPYQNHEFLS